MRFDVGGETVDVDFEAVVVAGFTGRDHHEVAAHLTELRAMGVSVPEQVPAFWVTSPHLAFQGDRIMVTHAETSGEAEPALVVVGSETLVTIASDHTDRLAEAFDIGLSKRLCPKVLGTEAWPYDDMVERWDQLMLRSWIGQNGSLALYQEAPVASLLHPAELLERVPFQRRPDRYALFTGTVATIGGIRPASRFVARLDDPHTGGSVGIDYGVVVLDVLRQ